MKSIITAIAAIAAVAAVALLIVPAVGYPMHIGEPAYYHTARVGCLMAAAVCGLAAIVSAIASAHF